MSADIELDDLSEPSKQDNLERRPYESEEARDDAVTLWVWVSSTLLLAAAGTLLLFPRFILFTAESSTEQRSLLTPLEAFLAVHFGIFLTATVAAMVLCIPSSTPVAPPRYTSNIQSHPLLGPITGACVSSAFISYNTSTVGPLAFLVFLGSTTIGLFGIWTILFAGSSRISKTTGADKHTSAFLFGNKTSAYKQKKAWKKDQKAKLND